MNAPSASLPVSEIIRNSRSPRIVDAVAAFLAEVDEEMASRSARCRRCGDCCDFQAYGHRMFVTSMELSFFLSKMGSVPGSSAGLPNKCIYQIDDICSVHPYRLLGCRSFLCDLPAREDGDITGERRHQSLRDLHEKHCVTYCYIEWREALALLSVAIGS